MIKSVVDQAYWDREYDHFYFHIADDVITEKVDSVIEKYAAQHPLGTCFEVGCFPGRYLAHFCKKYSLEANGVDAAAKMDDRFREWMESENILMGELRHGEAFSYIDKLHAENKTYDFVYSLGLIEHFTDAAEVVRTHAKIVGHGGLLVIVCPNFRGGLQYVMHTLVDRENRKRHVIRSMNPRKWARVLREEGFEILEAGSFGGFRFWAGDQKRGVVQQGLLYLFRRLAERGKDCPRDNNFYSPYCILAAWKKGG
jgi:SAM-dependent methyltransferase